MQEEYGTTATDTARGTCPAWCVLDHDDYDERALELGDLITHLDEVRTASGWSVWPDGAEEAESFTLQRYRHVNPDGRIEAEGVYFGDTAMTLEAATEVLEKLLAEVQSLTGRADQ